MGKTRQPTRTRVQAHMSSSLRERHTHKSRWIASTLNSGGRIDFRVLATATSLAEANRLECEQIAALRRAGARLTNGTDGGDGGHGVFVSEARREAIGARNRGKTMPPEVKAKISAALKGRPCPESTKALLRLAKPTETALANLAAGRAIGQTPGRRKSTAHRERLRTVNLGKSIPQDVRIRISAALRGRTFSEIHRARLTEARRARPATEPKPVVHGTRSGARRGCHCPACMSAQAAYARNLRASRKASSANGVNT